MLDVYARDFVGAIEGIEEVKQILRKHPPTAVVLTMPERTKIGEVLLLIYSHLLGLELQFSGDQVERTADALTSESSPVQSLELSHMLRQLRERIDDELKRFVCFGVTPSHAARYFVLDGESKRMRPRPLRDVYGERLLSTFFPTDDHDPAEAIQCLIHGRSTATVFHLMRMLEAGLTPLCALFGVSMAHTNWGPAIGELEKHIKDMHRQAPWKDLADCKDRQEAYGQAASHFDTLRIAWRNYTAHARGKYTEEEAENIFRNVVGFLAKVADLLVRYPAPATT